MAEGWIKVYRKVMNSFVWTNSDMFKLWMLCLMKANHTHNKFLFNGREVSVSSGEFVTGVNVMASEFNQGVRRDKAIAGRTLWRWLKKFESAGMLSIKSTTQYSVISVLNWDEYQQSVKPVTSDGQSTVKRLSTNNNDKNVKNEQEITTTTTENQNPNNQEQNPFEFFQQNGFGMISGFIGQDMNQWIGDFQQAGASETEANAIVVKSLQIAVERGKTNWGYAKAILKSWDQHNLHSIAAIDAEQAKHQQIRSSSNKPAPGFTQEREYTDDDLPF